MMNRLADQIAAVVLRWIWPTETTTRHEPDTLTVPHQRKEQ